jgi:hypothetical protein
MTAPDRPKAPPVKPGDVVTLNKPDYMCGTGGPILCITEVGRVQRLPDSLWLDVIGNRTTAGRLAIPPETMTRARPACRPPQPAMDSAGRACESLTDLGGDHSRPVTTTPTCQGSTP